MARDLGLATDGETSRTDSPIAGTSSAASVKLSIRMSAEEARQLSAGARTAGLSRGAYLAGLIANVPVLSAGGGRTEHIATLMASCAELSTLSRNVHRLTALLRQANVEPARPYREMLDTPGRRRAPAPRVGRPRLGRPAATEPKRSAHGSIGSLMKGVLHGSSPQH